MPPITPSPTDIPEDIAENASNAEHPGILMTDSDSISDDDNFDHEGYELLSQDPENCGSIIEEIEDDLNRLSDDEELTVPDASLNCSSLLLPAPNDESSLEDGKSIIEEIKMDEDHIAKIKSVMKGITLPSTCLPQWASLVPEEEWKAALFTEMIDKKSNCSNSNKRFFNLKHRENENDLQGDICR